MTYTYTYTEFPTIFEIEIRELGWIYDVYLEIDGIRIPAEWVGYLKHSEKDCMEKFRYSLFRVTYTFENVEIGKTATFHYFIDSKEYVCTPFVFNVYPFYDF